MERTEDQATAQGLRQHSIGEAFPAVVVAHLDSDLKTVLYYVQFMGHRTKSVNSKLAHAIAQALGKAYRDKGYTKALRLLTTSKVYDKDAV